jgi:hypothetical protein
MKLSRKRIAKTIARNAYERLNETNYVYSAFTNDKLIGMYELLSDNGIEMAYSMLYDIVTVTLNENGKIHKYEFTIEELQ